MEIQKRAWDQANEIAAQCAPYLAGKEHGRAGKYLYDHSPTALWYRFWREEGGPSLGRVHTFIITDHDYNNPGISRIYSLTAHFPEQTVSLRTHLISTQDRQGSDPSFVYEWYQSQDDPQIGKLYYLGIDFAEGTSLAYSTENFIRKAQGNLELIRRLPGTIRGRKAILGLPIPWEIRYEERARELLVLSEYEDFLRSLQNQQPQETI